MDFLKDQHKFSFLYGGNHFWNCAMDVKIITDGDCLTSEYTLSDGLHVTNIARKYGKYGAYEWVNWFENTAGQPSEIISELCDCDCEFPFEGDMPRPWTAYLPDSSKALKVYAPWGSTWELDEFYCNVDKNVGGRFPNHLFPGEFREYAASGGRLYRVTESLAEAGEGAFFPDRQAGTGAVRTVLRHRMGRYDHRNRAKRGTQDTGKRDAV